MNLKLENKIAFVSGSTQGIGYAISRNLPEEGTTVIVNGRTAEKVNTAVHTLKQEFGDKITGIAADFSNEEEVQQLIDNIPPVDILINNLGIDKSKPLIDAAIQKKRAMNLTNIDFRCEKLDSSYQHSERYDYAIASLFFHVIPRPDSIYLMKKMQEISDKIMVCGFSRPETLQQKTLLWLDQKATSHYQNFKAYQKNGYLEKILSEIRGKEIVTFDTPVPFVKIHVMS